MSPIRSLRGWKQAATSFVLVVVGAACSSSSGSASGGFTMVCVTPTDCCSIAESCASYAHEGIEGFMSGVSGAPDGFPAPPSGAQLCGAATAGGASGYYFAGSLTEDEVISYYTSTLTAAGYVVEDDGEQGCAHDLQLWLGANGELCQGQLQWVGTDASNASFIVSYPSEGTCDACSAAGATCQFRSDCCSFKCGAVDGGMGTCL